MVLVTYDPDAKALYVKINDERVVKTLPLGEGTYFDVSEDGEAVGLEIVFPRSTPQEVIDAIVKSKRQAIELLHN